MAAIADKKLHKVLDTIEKRKESYGQVKVAFAFAKNEKNEWKVCFGLISFLWKSEGLHTDETLDYGDFLLIKKYYDTSKTIELLHAIFENGTLNLGQIGEICLTTQPLSFQDVSSSRRYGFVLSEWAMIYAHSSIDANISNRDRIPRDPLSKIGLPLFPNGNDAIDNFFELNLPNEDWRTLDNRIEILLPDFRAKIKNLRLSGNRITLVAETRELSQDKIRAQFYCRGDGKSSVSKDVCFTNNEACFISENEPSIVEAHILSAVDGDSIDQRSYNYRYPRFDEGIEIETAQAQFLDMINKGESQTVEFKKELNPNNNKEFLESVIAFANTNGGFIFLGVDDNCRIMEYTKDESARIQDLIHGNCDPTVDFKIHQPTLSNGNKITIVEIPEGTNKPYSLLNRGYFVRRGSSDRQIKRSELDDLYAQKRRGSQGTTGY